MTMRELGVGHQMVTISIFRAAKCLSQGKMNLKMLQNTRATFLVLFVQVIQDTHSNLAEIAKVGHLYEETS